MKKINPVHPGEILKTEFLEPYGLSAYKIAKDISVPVNRITEIINGHRNISVETALLLARYFVLSDSFWIKVQARYDEATIKDKMIKRLCSISPFFKEEKTNSIKAV